MKTTEKGIAVIGPRPDGGWPESVKELVIGVYVGEVCFKCLKPLTRQDLNNSKWAPWKGGRVCHGSCWNESDYKRTVPREDWPKGFVYDAKQETKK